MTHLAMACEFTIRGEVAQNHHPLTNQKPENLLVVGLNALVEIVKGTEFDKTYIFN